MDQGHHWRFAGSHMNYNECNLHATGSDTVGIYCQLKKLKVTPWLWCTMDRGLSFKTRNLISYNICIKFRYLDATQIANTRGAHISTMQIGFHGHKWDTDGLRFPMWAPHGHHMSITHVVSPHGPRVIITWGFCCNSRNLSLYYLIFIWTKCKIPVINCI
jgi:hypothetical protein